MHIIDGKKLSKKILENLKKEIALLGFKPVFYDILVGENIISKKYVKIKENNAKDIGILFNGLYLSSSITTNELVEKIEELNKKPNVCGIIVQLPLPNHIDQKKVLDAINPILDVDYLGDIASNKFYNGEIKTGPPTALACIALLNSIDAFVDLNTRKKIVVLGRGQLVGKPVSALLSFKGFSPVTVHTQTENGAKIIKEADIIISGIGKSKYIKGDMIKKGVILIDAGTSESGASITGDIDFDSVQDVAGYITPTPGGVGPVTVAMLFKNVLQVAKNLSKNE